MAEPSWIKAFWPSIVAAAVALPQRGTLEVTGPGAPTATDDPDNDRTKLNFPGSTAPTGNGLAKVIAGAFAVAASLLVNADVANNAGIELKKISAHAAVATLEANGGGTAASGATNATAMRAAISSLLALGGGTLQLDAGTYTIDPGAGTPIVLGSGGVAGTAAKLTIQGRGKGRTIFSFSRNDVLFETGGDYVRLADLEIAGNGGGAQEAFRSFSGGAGPYVARSWLELENVRVRDVGLYGFWLALQGTPLHGPTLVNCDTYNCGYGFEFATEYIIAIGCRAKNCTVGVYNVSGNTTWDGGEITACPTDGLLSLAGGNDSHSTFTGCKFNHNGNAIRDTGTANGLVFTGCQMFDGAIRLTSSKRVSFVNCELASSAIYFDGSIASFSQCTLIGSYAPSGVFLNAINDSYNGHASVEFWHGCTDLDGAAVIGGYVSMTPAAGAQTLTYAQSYADGLELLAGVAAGFTLTSRRKPLTSYEQVIRNGTSQTCTFAWKGGGGSISIATLTGSSVRGDGTNARKMLP